MIKLVLLVVSVLMLTSTVQSWKLANSISNIIEEESDVAPIDQKSCPPCVCGQTNVLRIVGGSNVTYVNQYPWMAQIRIRGRFYCGASLINSKYVLTAAHCVKPFPKNFITIHLLEHDQTIGTESKVITRQVDHIIIHPYYHINRSTPVNDIALLRLDKEVELGIGVKYPSPVCLPDEGTPHNGVDSIVIGWGRTNETGSPVPILQEVTVPLISNDECSKAYDNLITPNMICAWDPKTGKDPCKGDSGGPLMVVPSNSKHHIIGIVSWGEGCGKYPGVYTKVKQYLKWIFSNTLDACPCLPN